MYCPLSHRSYFVVNLIYLFFSFIVYKYEGRYLSYVFPHFILSIYFCLSFVCVKVLVPQSYLTLCDPMDYSPPSSSAQGILQARILEWVAISSFSGSSQPRDWILISCITGRFFLYLLSHQGSSTYPLVGA